MAQSHQTIIERLRQLQRSCAHNNETINNLMSNPSVYTYTPMTSYYTYSKPIHIEQYHNADLYSQMMTDFEMRNKHIIESQLYYERSQNLLNDVLSMVDSYDDEELDSQISQLNLQSFDSLKDLKKVIPLSVNANKGKPTDQIKTITVDLDNKTANATKKQLTEEMDGPELDDLTDREQELVTEYVDNSYSHIIKVIKVYIILADGKLFMLPKPYEIQEMKAKLEGYLHVPDIDVIKGKIRSGTHIYYLSIDENSHVKLLNGYVLKTANTGLIIIDEENNKKKIIDFKCPIFRKINNLDIAIYIKLNQY